MGADTLRSTRGNPWISTPCGAERKDVNVEIAKLVLTIIQVIFAVILICVVILQSGKSAGLSGAIAGVAGTFMAKNKAKGWDAKLARWTKWLAIGFMLLSLIVCLL